MVIHQFIIKLVTIRQKITETLKLENSLNLKKTINFKVMKTIRNQLKYPIGLQLVAKETKSHQKQPIQNFRGCYLICGVNFFFLSYGKKCYGAN